MDRRKRAALAKLRDLQGPPLAVLFTMLIVRRPVTKSFLSMALRLDEKTVSGAVDFLEFEGHINRIHYRAWALNNGQLTLPGFAIGLLNADVPVLQAETGESPVSAVRTTTTTLIENSINNNVSSSSSTVCDETGESPVSGEIETVLLELRIGGEAINRNQFQRLAACEWATPRYLRAMAARINAHTKESYRNVGFFIHCVTAHDPEPEWHECCDGIGGHRPNCYRRYINA